MYLGSSSTGQGHSEGIGVGVGRGGLGREWVDQSFSDREKPFKYL